MKMFILAFLAMVVLISAGCKPDLVVESAEIDFDAQIVNVIIANIGDKDAGNHLTYIEINQVDAPHSAKPEAQYRANISGIAKGETWDSGPISFDKFSTRPTIDLNSLITANLVVRADAKDMVKESDENNNLYDANH